MVQPDTLLVGWLPNRDDLTYLERDHWYRIRRTAAIADEVLAAPPRWFAAFESTAVSGSHQQIARYAAVLGCQVRTRLELLGSDAPGPKQGGLYCQLLLGPIQSLESPLIPHKSRRNVFIRTTLTKLLAAEEFNDVFNDSPYENDLWSRLKALGAHAERQWPVAIGATTRYVLDFALFCRKRDVDVEVDGIQHHSVQRNSESDSDRDANLVSRGWAVHRVRVASLREDPGRCMNKLSETIERYGGVEAAAARYVAGPRGPVRQLQLLEERASYIADGSQP